MARLQKHFNRKVGDKEYSKYVVVIPEKKVKKAEFKDGQEIDINAYKGRITLIKSQPTKS